MRMKIGAVWGVLDDGFPRSKSRVRSWKLVLSRAGLMETIQSPMTRRSEDKTWVSAELIRTVKVAESAVWL